MVLGPPQQNCWTSAVLWMVLGPKGPMLSKLRTLAVLWMDLDTADLSSFMDGFGLSATDFIKTADLGSSMDYFSLKVEKPNKIVDVCKWTVFVFVSGHFFSTSKFTYIHHVPTPKMFHLPHLVGVSKCWILCDISWFCSPSQISGIFSHVVVSMLCLWLSVSFLFSYLKRSWGF